MPPFAVAPAEGLWVAARAVWTRPDRRGYRVDAVLARELRCGALQWAGRELGRRGQTADSRRRV